MRIMHLIIRFNQLKTLYSKRYEFNNLPFSEAYPGLGSGPHGGFRMLWERCFYKWLQETEY